MVKVALVLFVVACVYADEVDDSARQKRLLFFDEGGSLVRTYPNPYFNQLTSKDTLPFYGKFLNPFFNFIRAFGDSLAAFTIPVSNAIIQQIRKDPSFQQTLVVIPKNPVVEPSPLCQGKRTQIPSPSYCNNFLNCWDGWAFEQECPQGLLFSTEGYCDYAGNVDCHNRKLDYDKLQPQPLCSKDFEAFRNKENCNEFFVCVNRQPIRFKCPADLAYNTYLGVCDYPDRVGCQNSAAIIPAIPALPSLPTIPMLPSVPNPAPIPVTSPPADPIPSVPEQTPGSGIPEQTPESGIPEPQKPVSGISDPQKPGSQIPELQIPGSGILEPQIPQSPSLPPLPPIFDQVSIPARPPTFPFIPPVQHPVNKIPGLEIRPVFPPPKATDEKPALPYNIFSHDCSSNVAMSRQDAIRQLQTQTSN